MSGSLHLNIFLVLVCLIVRNDGFCSDSLTYFIDIKPIIDEHCTGCHRKGQTAPFSLESYEEVKKRASMVEMVVESKYMPPWHADTLFRTFHNQRALSEESLNKILNWIKGGAAEGLPQKRGAVNSFNWPSPDKIVAFQKPFIIPGDNEEQYRFFVIPNVEYFYHGCLVLSIIILVVRGFFLSFFTPFSFLFSIFYFLQTNF